MSSTFLCRRPRLFVDILTRAQLHRSAQFTISSLEFRKYISSNIHSSSITPDNNALLRLIKQHILASGPIPVPIWMNLCLNHPQFGYYSRTDRGIKNADPFGKAGDFVTSPEITQVFGELIALWFISRWQAAKSPPRVRIIELGPGRGTLMSDIIRTFRSLKACKHVDISIILVENSEFMREIQKQKLNQDNRIEWFDRIEQVEKVDDQWTMVIAHEFFDALPVHIFQKTEMGFREVMVDLIRNSELLSSSSSLEQTSLQFVLSPNPTLASQTLILKDSKYQKLSIGSKLEISPGGIQIAKSISHLLKSNLGGCGLIIDYGDEHHFSHSLRGFSQHKIVDPLLQPGIIDITANVDFSCLKQMMNPNVKTFGPITQKDFLLSMGIEVRTNELKKQSNSPESIDQSSKRLISPFGMGQQYKFLGFESSASSQDDNYEVYPFPPLSSSSLNCS